jgi:hypothetical protein
MKKKFTISAALLFITVMSFAQCPDYFMRNNGNGTCGSEAEIRMYFATCPAVAPAIDSIYVNGSKANVTVGAPDDSKCSAKGYISYCFSGNLPPANTLQVYFNSGLVADSARGAVCNVPSGPSAGPTPVVLSSFNAERGGKNAVNITWKTEQELNSSRYEIQRSFNNINFETVGVVATHNSNTSIAQYYSFTDNSNTANESSYYRLKMIDLDNSFEFSPVKAVKGSGFQAEVSIFPNPGYANQTITINNITEPSSISIFDYSGRLIQQVSSTGNSIQINNLQKGNYFVNITGKQTGTSSVKKLSVMY